MLQVLRLRHGRVALPKSTPLRPYVRHLSNASRRQQDLSAQHLRADPNRPALPSETYPIDPATLPPGIRTDIRDPNHPVAQDYILRHHNKARTSHLGATQEPHYRPHDLLANPPRPEDITLELLLASQTHIGHHTSLWHPANAQYIFGIRGDHDPIHIISLDTTAAYLRRACKVVHGVAERGGLILFVGTRAGQARTVVKAAQLSKGCHLFSRWTPGSITNGQQILGQCRKKVVNERDEEILGFQDQLEYKSAIKPDLVVCLNPLENYILLHECGLHNVPTIGIVDTDANPTWVTYPIPANDDSMRSVGVIAGALGRAGEAGQAARLRAARNGQINYFPTHGLRAPTAGQAQKEREILEREAQEERAYVDEGEVADDATLRQLELDAAAAGAQGEEESVGEMLDAGIEGAGEGTAGMQAESFAQGAFDVPGTELEGSEEGIMEGERFESEDDALLADAESGEEYGGESMIGEAEYAGAEGEEGSERELSGKEGFDADSYAIDRPLSSEELREGEGFASEDDLLEEQDRAQYRGEPDDDDGRRDR